MTSNNIDNEIEKCTYCTKIISKLSEFNKNRHITACKEKNGTPKYGNRQIVNSVLNNTSKLTGCRLLRVQFDKNSAKIDEVIGANEEQFRLTDTFATVTKFKLGNIAVIFLVADRIIWKTKSEASIPLSKLNECTLQGKVIMFEELVDGKLKWNKSYGPSITCTGHLSMILKLEMMASEDGFDYFVKESNFFNLKTYYESLITADEFDKNKIDSISCPYNKKISDHCTIQFHESETQQDNTKIKCKVHGCKWKKKINLVKMRLHVGWHIMNDHLTKDIHRCGYCGLVGCTLSFKNRSGYGENKVIGAKSDCSYYYEFSMKSSEKVPNSYPCSNRPVKCDHCEEIYWTYNMETHHLAAHNEMNFNSLITDNERALIKKFYSR
jgi:hypothetical protein